MNKIIYQVDSFTNEAFKGNPAGVVIVDDNATDVWMQNVAAEMNLAETAFLIKRKDYYDIRFFTPIDEIPLCGHATLASAHILYETGLEDISEKLIFKAKGGELNISNKLGYINMEFPVYDFEPIEINPHFKSLVGFEPLEMYKSSYGWIIAVGSSRKEIEESKPNFENLIKEGLGHLIITAESDIHGVDFVHRCFVPIVGINEDPVTGSAQCALVPLWNKKTGKSIFIAKQLSKRTGVLNLKFKGNSIEISGNAITIFKAECYV